MSSEHGRQRRRAGRTLRDRYPVFFAFERSPIRYLTHEESIAATPADRIKSVWPYLVKLVMRFTETLRPRERANYDPEDVLMELTTKLLEADPKWEPARGRYITFAARVVANELHKVRDRTRTVKSPGNTFCRLKEYEIEERAMSISAQRAATLEAMRRVLADSETLDDGEVTLCDDELPDQATLEREQQAVFTDAVALAVMGLTTDEAHAIAHAYGLWGYPERPVGEVAEGRRLTQGTIRATQSRARAKMRARLVSLGHPAADLIGLFEDSET